MNRAELAGFGRARTLPRDSVSKARLKEREDAAKRRDQKAVLHRKRVSDGVRKRWLPPGQTCDRRLQLLRLVSREGLNPGTRLSERRMGEIPGRRRKTQKF